ncbi:MAG: biotin--[Clostridia bacterium]|nr:biotin--[acetyl-CoA-carboxylase] ligase [Clostridia bacterium]
MEFNFSGDKMSIIGKKIIRIEETPSTNDLAKEYAKNGEGEGTVIVAEHQTKGKGRMGRSFFSPSGAGLYMSVILRPTDEKNGLLITSFASVAVCRAIKKVCGVSPKIKWVNDVYLNEKKVCGILTESLISEGKAEYIILGVGINVNGAEFPDDIKDIATSIEKETLKKQDKEALLREILKELDELYKTYGNGEFLEESRKLSCVLGKEIKVIRGNETYIAKAVDLDSLGGLIIERDGKKETLNSGEVSIRF